MGVRGIIQAYQSALAPTRSVMFSRLATKVMLMVEASYLSTMRFIWGCTEKNMSKSPRVCQNSPTHSESSTHSLYWSAEVMSWSRWSEKSMEAMPFFAAALLMRS